MTDDRTGLVLDSVVAGYGGGPRWRRRETAVAGPIRARARRGELTMLLGPNGAGKSTLIRTLCGLQPALTGRVRIDGVEVAGMTVDQLARRIAVVLTERIDPGFLSARELAGLGRIPHLGFGARLGPADDRIVAEALQVVGAEHLADRPAAELSDGERQRVLTARALAQQPRLLVLDEPTAFLDVASRTALTALLHRLARSADIAVLMSTHDLESALRTADRIWLLDAHGTLHSGVPEQLVADGLIGEVFDSPTARFDPEETSFVLTDPAARLRPIRLDVPDIDRPVLARQLTRESWAATGIGAAEGADGAGAQAVLTGDGPARWRIHRPGRPAARVTVATVPVTLRAIPEPAPGDPVLLGDGPAAALLTDIGQTSPYFRLETAAAITPLADLYRDPTTLAELVAATGRAMGVDEFRTAASTFFIGLAARLWSIGLGAAVLGRAEIDLDPAIIGWLPGTTSPTLLAVRPICWAYPGMSDAAADEPDAAVVAAVTDRVLTDHLTPLTAALAEVGPISAAMLRGNAATTAFGAGRMIDRRLGAGEPPSFGEDDLAPAQPGPGWRAASTAVTDSPLADAVTVDAAGGYRRRSCCLYYRAPGGGLCGDCVLDAVPQRRRRPAATTTGRRANR